MRHLWTLPGRRGQQAAVIRPAQAGAQAGREGTDRLVIEGGDQFYAVVLARPGREASAVRFSRHAKNEMRLYGITPADVSAVVAAPTSSGEDAHGNRRLTGPDANGRAIIVVIADDDPGFVITTFPDD